MELANGNEIYKFRGKKQKREWRRSFDEGSAGLLGRSPPSRPKTQEKKNTRKKYSVQCTVNESPGKGHTSRYEDDDDEDDGDPKGI